MEKLRHQFGGGDRLDGLAQPHVISNQTPTSPDGEERPFLLIRVEIDLQQGVEERALDAIRHPRIHNSPPVSGVLIFGDIGHHIVVAAYLVAVAARDGFQKRMEIQQTTLPNYPVAVEIFCGQKGQFRRSVFSCPETDLPLQAVTQPNLGPRRGIPFPQTFFRSSLLRQFCQDEFDMLAGAQVVDVEIGTGAVIHPRRLAADRDSVCLARFRIGQGEFGKERVGADIFQDEGLLFAKLLPQGALPVLQ